MSWLPAIQQLLTFTFDFADGWQDRQREKAQQQHELRLQAMQQHPSDWKDEVVLFLVSYPIVSAFIPWFGISDNTLAAIDTLKKYPQWMTGTFVTICLAVYGINRVLKAKK